MIRKRTLPPNPSRLIEGLRDTGYDFNTALSDIIDNSVDAEAVRIDIQIRMEVDGSIYISVADNGYGMDEEALLNGMTYGSTGEADPKRLGKFGLGLKTASTAFCRKLSVCTRDSAESEILKAIWDLDHVGKVGEWELLLDDPSSFERKILNDTATESSGTVIIWDLIDRLMKPYADPSGAFAKKALKKRVDSFREHAAMIYQRFLDRDDDRARNIDMFINGEIIQAWNPFCEKEEETELVAEKVEPVELPDGTKTDFTIRAFILPRREHFSDRNAATSAKLSNKMQGLYIYRENRLIHPADWLGAWIKEPHFSLLRVEFSFNHFLDEAFQVDIKKSRILLNEDLHKWLFNEFLPAPRNAAEERYRKGDRKKVNNIAKSAHEGSNKSISDKEEDLRSSEITVIDGPNNEVEIKNKSGVVRLKLNIGTSQNTGEVCVQPQASLQDGLLWEPALIDMHHAVRINTGHPYYHKVYIPNLTSDVTIQGMDSLLWALVEAELSTVNHSTKQHFQELRFEISRLLRKLVEDLPEPDLSDDDES